MRKTRSKTKNQVTEIGTLDQQAEKSQTGLISAGGSNEKQMVQTDMRSPYLAKEGEQGKHQSPPRKLGASSGSKVGK